MQRALTLYGTSIGKKAVMAVSGVVLLGFVVGHLAGNLNAYFGPRSFNEYANSLRDMPSLLWGIRALLLISVTVHIAAAFSLVKQNRAARPDRYAMRKDIATTYAARMMPWTGLTLLFYILFHLAHLTFGLVTEFDVTNPYNNLVLGFQNPWISAFYIAGNLSLGVHLYHGIWSMFQSVGANHPRYNRFRTDLAVGLATFLTIGFLSFPIMVMAGLLQPTTEEFSFPNLR